MRLRFEAISDEGLISAPPFMVDSPAVSGVALISTVIIQNRWPVWQIRIAEQTAPGPHDSSRQAERPYHPSKLGLHPRADSVFHQYWRVVARYALFVAPIEWKFLGSRQKLVELRPVLASHPTPRPVDDVEAVPGTFAVAGSDDKPDVVSIDGE